MRCQYCGKRLPLFRKLKDGEFCSAAHREQFLAQSDQLGVAVLQEQRDRALRAGRIAAAPLAVAAVTQEESAAAAAVGVLMSEAPVDRSSASPAQEASFSHRYLVSSFAALPLGQLARVPLEPMSVRQPLLMPERFAPPGSSQRATGNRILGETPVQGLPADQLLRALNIHGAPASGSGVPAVAEFRAAATFGLRRLTKGPAAGLITCGWVEQEFALADAGEMAPVESAAWASSMATTPGVPRLQLELATEPIAVEEEEWEWEWAAVTMAHAWPVPHPVACSPLAELLVGREPNELKLLGDPARRCWPLTELWRSLAGLALAGLEDSAVRPVSPPLPLATAGAKVRFPALVPVFSTMPVRRRAALRRVEAVRAVFSPGALPIEEGRFWPASAGEAIPVLTPQILLAAAHATLAGRLGITGELSDLLSPSTLAPPRRIPWRFEAQNVFAIRTLAIRHLAMDVKLTLPARPSVRVGPRRAEQQLRLNALLRPAQFDFSASPESVSFHLEPKAIRPRLRAQPDPARQGGRQRGTATRKGENHADAAVSSIKIPVLRRFWAHAPADIRWVALIIPLVFFLAWYSWTPNGKALNKQAESADLAVDTSGVQTAFASFKTRISNRAAVELSEDFRTGLAEWQGSRQDWAENWSYDQAGFIRPGNLALFTPTVGLRDYNFEFLGQIENRALSWVYRAKDAHNYYLGRLVITRGGPIPEVSLVRSMVKNGRESKQKLTVLTMNLRTDTIYRVRVDINGSDFTTSVLGQVVDTFTDASHPQGGIGFYGGRGETSRIRWVEVSHQYDTLGRLCAMLVPYELAGAGAPVKANGPAAF